MEYNNGRITKEAEKMNEVKKENKKAKDVNNVREAADNITDQLDEQALANFELNLQVNKYRSELRHALMQLDEHTYCPNEVDINCDPKGGNLINVKLIQILVRKFMELIAIVVNVALIQTQAF